MFKILNESTALFYFCFVFKSRLNYSRRYYIITFLGNQSDVFFDFKEGGTSGVAHPNSGGWAGLSKVFLVYLVPCSYHLEPEAV